MSHPVAALFLEIADHPGFKAFLGGLNVELVAARRDLENHEGTPGMDFALEVIRLQERVKVLRWVTQEYPVRLTASLEQEQPVATGGEDAYETPTGEAAFRD